MPRKKVGKKGIIVGASRLSQDLLKYFLESMGILDIVIETDDASKAISLTEKESPDVIILDEEITREPAKLVRELLSRNGSCPLVLLASHAHPSYVFEAIDAGARVYVEKNKVGTPELASVINEVLEKESSAFHVAMDRGSLSDLSSREHKVANRLLTDHELQILKYIADGDSNKKIAKEACISEQTAKVHVHNIFTKLGARDRAQAVALGFRKKLLS